MTHRWTLYGLLSLWIGLFVYSFFSTAGVEPLGDGFTRGLNRVTLFLKWHGSAFAFAIAGLFLGWRQDSKGLRWVSRIPVITHILAVVGTLAVATYFYQQEKNEALEARKAPPAQTQTPFKPAGLSFPATHA